jgi:hypothetical protein
MADMADTADTADIMANKANILARYRREADASSAEAGRNSAAPHREHTATGEVETGVAVIGAAIGGVAVTGAAAADSSLSAEVIRTIGIGILLGAGAFLTRITAIILISIIRLTVAPYQDSDSLGPDQSWFPAPASPGIVPAESQRLKATMALEITGVLMRVDHVDRFIVNANHNIM